MDVLDEEILNLWRAFSDCSVRYILVGGFATSLHGYGRYTSDVDIWFQDTAENRKKLRKALNQAGLGDLKEIETTQFVPGFTSITLKAGMELDIMTSLTGFPGERFEQCYDEAETAVVHDITVRFLHLNHLLESKKAAGRPKDLIDIEELQKLHEKK